MRREISEIFRVKFIRTYYWAITSFKVPTACAKRNSFAPVAIADIARANAPGEERISGEGAARGGHGG